MEKQIWYLVCNDCGESFDEIQAARDHEDINFTCDEATYKIVHEEEAF